jgi:hypothetical protein
MREKAKGFAFQNEISKKVKSRLLLKNLYGKIHV